MIGKLESNPPEVYRFLCGAKTLDELTERVGHILRPIGITQFSHAYARQVNNILDPYGSFDPKITDQYGREGFHHDDLTTRFLLRSPKPIFRTVIDNWVEIAPAELDIVQKNREVVKFLNSHGIHEIYSLPILEEDYYALFSVSSINCPGEKFREIVNNNKKNIEDLGKMVDEIGRKKFGPKFRRDKTNPRIPVTPKPLQLIEVLANKDLTLNEAAEVLNMSISTANQHVAAAKKALGAATTHGLILAAQSEGLIKVSR